MRRPTVRWLFITRRLRGSELQRQSTPTGRLFRAVRACAHFYSCQIRYEMSSLPPLFWARWYFISHQDLPVGVCLGKPLWIWAYLRKIKWVCMRLSEIMWIWANLYEIARIWLRLGGSGWYWVNLDWNEWIWTNLDESDWDWVSLYASGAKRQERQAKPINLLSSFGWAYRY